MKTDVELFIVVVDHNSHGKRFEVFYSDHAVLEFAASLSERKSEKIYRILSLNHSGRVTEYDIEFKNGRLYLTPIPSQSPSASPAPIPHIQYQRGEA